MTDKSDFFEFLFFFSNHVWKLGVRLIHECGLYTSLYGIYLLYFSCIVMLIVLKSDSVSQLIHIVYHNFCDFVQSDVDDGSFPLVVTDEKANLNLCFLLWRFGKEFFYSHLGSTVRRHHFFAKVYFSNIDGLVSYLSRLIMKCLRLGHKIDNNQKFKILI